MKEFIILIISLLIIQSVNALNITTNSTLDDDTVIYNYPSTNYGTSSYLYMYNTTLAKETRVYIKFNISSLYQLDDGFKITSARLYLQDAQGNNAVNNVCLNHVYNQSWNENLITWDDQPCKSFDDNNLCNLTSSDCQSLSGVLSTLYVWNITEPIRYEYSQGNSNVSFILNKQLEDVSQTGFWSKEAILSHRPYIIIDYIPLAHINYGQLNYLLLYGKRVSNHNSCIDNITLSHNITYQITIDNNQSTVSMFVTEPCEYGCDITTNKCNESTLNQYLIVGLVLTGIVLVIIIIIKVIK